MLLDLLSTSISKSIAKGVDREFPNQEIKERIINQYTKNNKLEDNQLQKENKEIREDINNEKQNEKIKNEEKIEEIRIEKKIKEIKDIEIAYYEKLKDDIEQQNIDNLMNTWCSDAHILKHNISHSGLYRNEKLFYDVLNDVQENNRDIKTYNKNNGKTVPGNMKYLKI